MTTETSNTASEKEDKRSPDYTARQYRYVRLEDGLKLRKETVGAAWRTDKGAIMFRPNGMQIIENDIYLFPTESKEAQ